MKRHAKRTSMILFTALALGHASMMGTAMTAAAADGSDYTQAISYTLGDTVELTAETNTTLYYAFTLEEKGSIDLSAFCADGGIRIHIYDDNFNNLYADYMGAYPVEAYASTGGIPETDSHTFYANAGKYYAVVSLSSDTTSSNFVITSTECGQTDEEEPNHSLTDAQQIELNTKYTGFLATLETISGDTFLADYYKISISEAGDYTLQQTTRDFQFFVHDANGDKIDALGRYNPAAWDGVSKLYDTITFDAPGTYYLITSSNCAAGPYQFQLMTESAYQQEINPTETTTEATETTVTTTATTSDTAETTTAVTTASSTASDTTFTKQTTTTTRTTTATAKNETAQTGSPDTGVGSIALLFGTMTAALGTAFISKKK